MSTNIFTQPQDWREGRRFRAWELKQQGWKQQDIAKALGVSPGAVSQWLKAAREGGPEALRRHPAPGPQPRLTPEQKAEIPELLAKGAEAYGFGGDLAADGTRAGFPQPGCGSLSEALVASHPRQAAGDLGWLAHSPRPTGQ